MTISKLSTYKNLNPKHSGKRNQPITKIAIHHTAGKLSAKSCCDYHKNTKRKVSANYYIGHKGDIACGVAEENRAWTTSSSWCDNRAITIEVSNDINGHPWTVSKASYKALIELIVDIAKRYEWKPITYTGDKNGTLQKHEWFANTNCPGPHLGSLFPQIVKDVNAKLIKKVEPGEPALSIDSIARRVIRGDYGNGKERVDKLTALGYDYKKVQSKVNDILRTPEYKKYHTVKRGDTLYSLARKYNTTVKELARLNGIKNPNVIYTGDTLRVV